MGALGSFLASFTESFRAALVIWPFLSFALTLPILAYLYHRDGRLRLGSALVAYLCVLYLAGLACFTLYPLPSGNSGPGITYGIPPQFDPFNFVHDIAKDGWKAVLQVVFNIVLFMPLGFIMKRFLRAGLPLTTILALVFTCLIETAQLTGLFGIYPYAYRTFEVDDIIFNTLGGVLGWLCGSLADKVLPEKKTIFLENTSSPGLVRRCVALWIDALIIGLFTFGPWLFCDLLSEVLTDQPFALPGMNAAQTENAFALVCFILSFAAVELLIPWRKRGSTPGGQIVRMTCETKERTGWKRLTFFGARGVFLLLIFVAPQVVIPLTLLFYLFKRKMPYDFLP